MATIQVTTGDELRLLREERGITQGQLAAAMGTTQQYVSTIEQRAIVKPRTADRYRRGVYGQTYTPQAEAG